MTHKTYKTYKPYTKSGAGYERLIVYWLATTIYDLTVVFTSHHIKAKKQKDQMDGAARSGKQNIVEGWLERSLEGALKLLGVARASFGELKEDYLDYLRQNNLPLWDKADPRIRQIRQTPDLPYKTYKTYKSYVIYTTNDEALANLIVTLCCKESFLLDRLIKSTEQKFIQEGGFRENLFKKRQDYRLKTGD
jgi:four helix bundle suffix protein